jgi:hypothetical protein
MKPGKALQFGLALAAASLTAAGCARDLATGALRGPASSASASASLALGRAGPLAAATEPPTLRFRSFHGGNLPPRTEAKACKALPENLRGLFYEHFLYYVDRHGKQVGVNEALAFARLLARAWDDSRGNPANAVDGRANGNALAASRFVTDNLGREARDSRAQSSLESRNIVLRSPRIHMDRQTRFGLLKASATQLASPGAKAVLDEIQGLALRNPDAALDRCGAEWMYVDAERALKHALVDTARCKPGTAPDGEVRCFARWVTLCPNLGLTLGLLRDAAPAGKRPGRTACAEAFRSLIPR